MYKYENHNTTNRIMIYTSLCNTLRCPSHTQKTASPGHHGVLMHLVCKFISYGIAIAICSSQFLLQEEKQKYFMFICTICCLGTESNVYKTRELKDKAELKDRKARCIKPV